jgi:hypothetical protein
LKNQIPVEKNIIFNVATVMDLGLGIQETLPRDIREDLAFDNLNIAFQDGITRKNTRMREKSGYGFGQAVNAAIHLGALLHVVSGEFEALLDLSDKNLNNNRKVTLLKHQILSKRSGTSISILWMTKP